MYIRFFSGESLGTRGMATYVEVDGLRVFIDPGVALGPRRYGLPPHPVERYVMDRQWRDIVRNASSSDIVVVTHYHYDHHNPREYVYEVYGGKDVFIKDPYNFINPSQIRRSRFFMRRMREEGVDLDSVHVADGSKLYYGDVYIEFSPPFYHGENPRLGYVVMVYIECGDESLLYSSDVEGPMYDGPYKYILGKRPKILILDGPPTYLDKVGEEALASSLGYISNILRMEELEVLILEHHFLRDRRYLDILKSIDGFDELGWKVMNFASYMKAPQMFYEMIRDELYYGQGG